MEPVIRKPLRGFTLVELLIAIAIVALLAAIAIPKFQDSTLRSREATLRAMLKQIRDAGDRAEADTGLTVRVSDLTRTTAPSTGWLRSRMNTAWTSTPVDPATWKGPYLDRVPINPFTGTNTYAGGATDTADAWTHFSVQSFNPNYFYFPSTKISSLGTAYRTW